METLTMQNYLMLMNKVITFGEKRSDRTGTGTLAIFGENISFDLRKRFPLVTTKRVWLKGVWHELLWMLSGSTNINYLRENGVHIWDAWADEAGELGPVYGAQWRQWWVDTNNRVDQITNVIRSIKTEPHSRR